MKHAVSIVLVVVLLLIMTVVAPALGEDVYAEPERYASDELTWEFDESTGALYIHGAGPMRSYWDEYPEWDMYRDQVTSVQLDDGITSIGDCAFYDFGYLRNAVLPDSIEVIDRYAFYYCWALDSITIPTSLRYVGEMSFYNTSIHNHVDIVFPEGTEYIGDNAFHSAMKTYGKYVIPSTVRYIGACALSNAAVSDIVVDEHNTYFKSENHALMTKDGTELMMYAPDAPGTIYEVPEGVVKINEECFNVAQNLEKIIIPASVTQIEDAAIFTTFNLKEIIVADDNPAYKIIDGALCSIDGKTYLAFPDGIALSEIVIPDGVERIAPYVFYGRHTEKLSVVLPETLKTIGTLSLPTYISSIYIPKSVETIEPNVFFYEGGVEEVIYGGSEADWLKIDIGEGNCGLDSVAIKYPK